MGRTNAASRAASKSHRAVVALDLGGTKLACTIFTAQGEPIAKTAVPLDKREGPAVGKLIVRHMKRLLLAAAKRGLTVDAVGISVPGISHRNGRVWAPNIPGWQDYPLRDEVSAAIADAEVKVVIDSDRAASILGEAWQGAARGCRDAVFVAVGTGIGAGIMLDGRVVQGAHGIAGAIGWLALDRPFRTDYTACGCFESHASGDGIAAVAKSVLAHRKGYRGLLRSKSALTAHDVFDAHACGDQVATEVLTHAIEFWGMASANLVSLFNPEMVVFGGGVFGPAAQFLDAIAREARRWAQPVAMEQVAFAASQLGSDAALYGAAYIAMHGSRAARVPSNVLKD